ncbi:lamin tail domain-containing protein 1 isoform 4, partial [Daubentonia madagascariensis]
MKGTQDIQEASEARQSEVHKQEDEVEKQELREDRSGVPLVIQRSSVHFFPNTSSVSTTLTFSQSSSCERPLNYYYLSSPQISGAAISTTGPLTSKATIVSGNSLEVSCLLGSKKQTLLNLGPETPIIGEGEDYFLSLFGDSTKLTAHSRHTEKPYKHFSMILEEVGQSTSSSLGDIEIAEVNVKGLFVKLVNSSLDKELAIGDHILQQNVNGQRVSLYRFLPNIIMQANSTVTAVAWYTPIHWKQAWEKLETDIEFDRSSVVTPKFRRHMFRWTASATTVTTETHDQPKKDTSKCQLEQDQIFLKREKEIPPTLFPNHSPWCQSPYVPAHPYGLLIEPHDTGTAGSRLSRQPRSQSARLDPAPGTKKKNTSKLQKQY